MKGVIDEGKEISPMFPRLHVKDAKKGGPKAPPRNKMALYEQFSIPSQSFASGSGSASLFQLPQRNCTVHPTSSHGGSSQNIQCCTSSAPSSLSEKIQSYNARKINLNKLTQDNFINSKNSSKALDGEDAFISSGSAHGRNSFCGIIQNDKDEDKFSHSNLKGSLKSLSSFRRVVNSPRVMKLKSGQHGRNHMEEPIDVFHIGHKPEEEPSHPVDGCGDLTDVSLKSLVKGRNSKSMKKEHRSLKEEIRSISLDSIKTFQGSNAHTNEEHTNFGDKINLMDQCMEKPAASDVQECAGKSEIGKRCFLGKRDGNKDEQTYKHYDALIKPRSECIHGVDISPDNIVGVIGEKQFWKARRTIINQQRIFLMHVFELHRLIKVQRLIAESPRLLLEDNLTLNKPPLKTSTPKKSQPDFVSEQPPSFAKFDSKSENAELDTNKAVEKILLPCINNISKSHVNQLPNLGNLAPPPSADMNFKQSPSCVYPPPGNQWLVPVMSPSEGLVYKPIIGPYPPNAGFMTSLYGACGPMSFNPGSKYVPDASLAPNSHQRIGIVSGSSLPQFLPPCGPSFMHSTIPASIVEQMGQSNGPENHHSYGEVNSAILYQSSSNMSSQTSQVMSRNISNHHSLKDKELQTSTASSPSKRMKGDVLPLFPMAPTFLPSTDENSTQVEKHPRVIKALPHNPKSATESAARIFSSIQEERKHL